MKKLFVVLLMLCTFVANAQKFQSAKLVFSSGKSITGLAKAPEAGDKYISMKPEEKAPKEKISSDELSKIIFTEEGSEPVEYVREYTAINGKKSANPLWMQVIVSGPATLYGLGSSMMTTSGGSFGHKISDINFYAKRAGEDGATFVGQHTTQGAIMIGENLLFKKHAAKYFADNTALVAKIESKEYKITDIVVVVNEYNQWKKGKK